MCVVATNTLINKIPGFSLVVLSTAADLVTRRFLTSLDLESLAFALQLINKILIIITIIITIIIIHLN